MISGTCDVSFGIALHNAEAGNADALVKILLSVDTTVGMGERARLAEFIVELTERNVKKERGRKVGSTAKTFHDRERILAEYDELNKSGEMKKNAKKDMCEKHGISEPLLRSWITTRNKAWL